MIIQELLALREAAVSKALSDRLDQKAKGADDVTLDGKKYVRTGPKNALSQPGPWRLVKEEELHESAAKAAAKLGLATGRAGKRPLSKDQVQRSFGGNYEEYIAAYKAGKREFDAKNDHEAWQEKRAAALQGRHYHE